MKNKLYILLLIPFLFFCTQKEEASCVKHEQEKSVMYIPSELALLMKDMYKVNEKWKAEIEKGNIPKDFPIEHKKILTAKSSNARAESDFYKSMALVYLNNVEWVTQADTSNVKTKFNGMINTCISCHEQICQGPISRIKKLFIK
jgi:cytochrome c556